MVVQVGSAYVQSHQRDAGAGKRVHAIEDGAVRRARRGVSQLGEEERREGGRERQSSRKVRRVYRMVPQSSLLLMLLVGNGASNVTGIT